MQERKQTFSACNQAKTNRIKRHHRGGAWLDQRLYTFLCGFALLMTTAYAGTATEDTGTFGEASPSLGFAHAYATAA